MKKIRETITLFCLALALLFSNQTMAAGQEEISVYLNGVKVEFGENKPLIKNAKTLVPAKAVFGSVGADVLWNGEAKMVTVELDGKSIDLKIGDKQATYRTSEASKIITSEVAPEIINGTTYVPLRLITESLGAKLDWSASEWTARLTFDGEDVVITAKIPEAPEEPLKTVASPLPGVYEISGINLEMKVSSFNAVIDDELEGVEAYFGIDSSKSESVYGYAWKEINAGGDSYALVGGTLGKIVALYSNSKKVTISGITPGMTAAELNRTLGAALKLEDKSVIRSDGGNLTIYRNALKDYSVMAVMAQKTGFTAARQKITTQLFTEPTEALLAGIINTERLNQGVAALKINESISLSARSHSEEMAAQNYLSGTDSSGDTTLDRINKSVPDGFLMAAESIGRDAIDAIEIYHQWMNDKMDAANIIDYHFSQFGIGVAPCPNNHKMYFTVDYIEK